MRYNHDENATGAKHACCPITNKGGPHKLRPPPPSTATAPTRTPIPSPVLPSRTRLRSGIRVERQRRSTPHRTAQRPSILVWPKAPRSGEHRRLIAVHHTRMARGMKVIRWVQMHPRNAFSHATRFQPRRQTRRWGREFPVL